MILLAGFTEDPTIGPYLRGMMRIKQVSLHTPLAEWLDVVYALWVGAPHDIIGKARKILDDHAVRVAPDRDTWGLLPEHVAAAGQFAELADKQ